MHQLIKQSALARILSRLQLLSSVSQVPYIALTMCLQYVSSDIFRKVG